MASLLQSSSLVAEQNEPITERSNDLTENIDISDSLGIVRLLRQVDAQLFAGWRNWEGILDDSVLSAVDRVTNTVVQFLEDTGNNVVILSGCGTSGRVAFLTAKTFNALLIPQKTTPFYHYIISGGDRALLKSQEAIEDSWTAGVCSLEQVIENKKKVLFIGITCGLSAPFVAAQLHHCLKHSDKCTPVLLGFNLPSMARTTKAQDSELSFKDVVDLLLVQEAKERAFVLTPIVGPEAIAGSTRLKSGSATMMLLGTILMRAHRQLYNKIQISASAALLSHHVAYSHTFLQCRDIAAMMELAGRSLSAGRHVYYLGVNTVGILALIDASECPPTFGSNYGDVRAFLLGGNTSLGLQEGLDKEDPDMALGWDHFENHFLQALTPQDTVVFVISRQDMDAALAAKMTALCSTMNAQKGAILVGAGALPEVDASIFNCCVRILLPRDVLAYYWSSHELKGEEETLLSMMAVKWVLNTVSTGAHVMKGKVLRNRMADLQLSNNKLFYRAVKIVEDFSCLSKQEALKCVLSAVYMTDNVNVSLLSDSVEKHVCLATHQKKVMPLALLKSTGRFTIREAFDALQQDPVIRRVLSKHTAVN